jgi:hypothetical protein
MRFWLASFPRSGNTFLRIVLRTRYAVRSVCTESERTGPAPRTFRGSGVLTPDYEGPGDPVVPGVLGLRTHALPPNVTDPAVYVVRDGRDSLVSYAHFALAFVKNLPPEEITPQRVAAKVREFILEPRLQYGTWSQNVDAWTRRPNTLVVRFEDLVERPGPVVDDVVDRLGLRLAVASEAIPTFGELNSAAGKFFRRGAAGAWPEVFTPELHSLFWKHNGTTMTRLGYGRDDRRAAA